MRLETKVQKACQKLTPRQIFLWNFLLKKNCSECVFTFDELGISAEGAVSSVQGLMDDLMALQGTSFWHAAAADDEELIALIDSAKIDTAAQKVYVWLGAAARFAVSMG